MRPGRVGLSAAAGIAVGIVLFTAAIATGRPDVAVFGAVALVAVGVALLGERGARPGPVHVVIEERDDEPSPGAAGRRLLVRTTAPGAEMVRLTIDALGFDRTIVAVPPSARVEVMVPLVHSGPQELLSVTAQPVAAEGVRIGEQTAPAVLAVGVPPRAVRLRDLPLPRQLGGRVGEHDARRPGSGGQFHDLHPFAPGDRLLRIDWKATARLARAPGELFVRRTLATADADVALVIDDRDDLSGAPGEWSSGDRSGTAPTSLDVAREAAWSLATAYLDAGDQVALLLVSRGRGDLARGAGPRQRHALRSAITAVRGGSPVARVGAPRVPRGSLVVLISTVLDELPVSLALRWRGSGHRVLLVDSLPRGRTAGGVRPAGKEKEGARPGGARREELIAGRIVLGERDRRIRELRDAGTEVVRWDAEPGEVAAALRAAARPRRSS